MQRIAGSGPGGEGQKTLPRAPLVGRYGTPGGRNSGEFRYGEFRYGDFRYGDFRYGEFRYESHDGGGATKKRISLWSECQANLTSSQEGSAESFTCSRSRRAIRRLRRGSQENLRKRDNEGNYVS